MRILALIGCLLLSICSAFAQSTPNLTYGQVPSAAQWNSYFAAKQDVLGFTPLGTNGGTLTGPLHLAPSTTFGPSLGLPPGVAPGTPQNGDLWATNTALFYRMNGVTINFFGGTSVTSPGTGTFEVVFPIQAATGASKVFATADLYQETRRSNGGAAMSDTFPAAGTIGLVNGTRLTVTNADGSATDTITAGSGTTLNGGTTDTVIAGASAQYTYDAPNTMWRRTGLSGGGGGGGALLAANNLSDLTNVPAARGPVGLNLESVTTVGDINYTIQPTDVHVVHSTLTVSRTDTLPLASSVNAGRCVTEHDHLGLTSGTKTISVTNQGSDTINNVAGPIVAIAAAFNGLTFCSDGVSHWSYEPVAAAAQDVDFFPPQGRLTLASGTPVMATSVSGAGTVYYTPYTGNLVPVWNGTNFSNTAFTELSQATTDATKSPAAVVASSLYDVFVWLDGATLRATRGPVWLSATTRGTGAGTSELIRQGGTLVNRYAITNGPAAGYGSYVGTIASNSLATIDFIYGSAAFGGGAAVFNVWNQYNRVDIATLVNDTSGAYPYASAFWRVADNSANMRITYVCGNAEEAVISSYQNYISLAGSTGGSVVVALGIGVDTVSSANAISQTLITNAYGAGDTTITANYAGMQSLGFHYLQAMEYGNMNGNSAYFSSSIFATSILTMRTRM